jgi:exodeoxyribonuclease VII large subunit
MAESKAETDQLILSFRRSSMEELSGNRFFLNRLTEGLCRSSAHTLQMATQTGVEAVRNDLRRLIQAKVSGIRSGLLQLFSGMKSALSASANQKKAEIEHFEKLVAVLDPVSVLRRGYSLTLSGDKIITSASGIHAGEILTTRFRDGEATSQVINIEIQSDYEE